MTAGSLDVSVALSVATMIDKAHSRTLSLSPTHSTQICGSVCRSIEYLVQFKGPKNKC